MPSIINTIKDIERARQIVTVLARHGFAEVVQRIGMASLLRGRAKAEGDEASDNIGLPVRLRRVLEELGPSFIKLGQILSTRPDLVPEDIVIELRRLQDNVPPMPLEDVRETIEGTLGAPLDELFIEFDDEPLACASIGQVHRAKLLHEGLPIEVVVKVQRARIRHIIERDIDLLYLFANLVERTIPEAKIYSPVRLVREFDQAIMSELDFLVEAENAERFARNFQDNTFVRFPVVYRRASSRKVLTIEFFDGHKLEDALAKGYNGEYMAKRALQVIAQMIFEDGFFHADPHPGNMIYLGKPSSPVIGMIDLGLVGRINNAMRDKIIDLMVAAVRQDTDGLADALLNIGKVHGKLDQDAFRAEVAILSERYLGKPIQDIELSALIRDLIQGAIRYQIEMPQDMLMMGKSLVTIEGVGKQVYPELDVLSELRPYFLRLLWQRYHPAKVGRELLRTMSQLKDMAVDLPSQLNTILEDLRSGQLEVQVHNPTHERLLDRLGRRLFSAVFAVGLILCGVILLSADRQVVFAWILVGLGFTHSVLHAISDVTRRKRRSPWDNGP